MNRTRADIRIATQTRHKDHLIRCRLSGRYIPVFVHRKPVFGVKPNNRIYSPFSADARISVTISDKEDCDVHTADAPQLKRRCYLSRRFVGPTFFFLCSTRSRYQIVMPRTPVTTTESIGMDPTCAAMRFFPDIAGAAPEVVNLLRSKSIVELRMRCARALESRRRRR